ncbi:MAG: (d)CMP kinase, partial [Planctomycetes bacterium]|nr:(d)CMP kinase [Planctomycetota bacterium]
YEDVLDNLRSRDNNDRGQWAPLLAFGQAIQIDTTQMSITEVVALMLEEIGKRK